MSGFHISNDGQPRRCGAKSVASCRAKGIDGGKAQHFNNLKEAEDSAQKSLEERYGKGSTIKGKVAVGPGVSEILKTASKASHPKQITEDYARNNLLGGSSSKLEFLQGVSEKNISKETKAAIGKMALRADINLSYNDLGGKEFSTSQVDLIDEEVHQGTIKDYVAAGIKDLPWTKD